jgi:hypothetical protein
MTGDYCDRCPARGLCLKKYPAWCELARDLPPDSTEVRHILDVSRMAAGLEPLRGEPARQPEYPEYPPLATQAGNALKAAGRVVAAAVKGEPIRVPLPVYYDRLEVCRACEFNGERPAGVHCMKCGCGGMKLELATEKCPIDKWPRWEKPTDDAR